MQVKEPDLAAKRIFLVVSDDEKRSRFFSQVIDRHIASATIFTAVDGNEALFKITNAPPHVLITEADLPRLTGFALVEELLKKNLDISIIIVSELPDREHFIDEVVTHRVQFLHEATSEARLTRLLTQALNRLDNQGGIDYRLRFLAPGEILFQQGDVAQSVYILKRGLMRAFIEPGNPGEKTVVLGDIVPGEFVGEMAHINQENRSASVSAVEDCELIEIPRGTLDLVLFSKPAWAQALVKTLSKRLKKTNDILVSRE